jgi:hypothetical protein
MKKKIHTTIIAKSWPIMNFVMQWLKNNELQIWKIPITTKSLGTLETNDTMYMAIEINHHNIEQCTPHICRKGFKKGIIVTT